MYFLMVVLDIIVDRAVYRADVYRSLIGRRLRGDSHALSDGKGAERAVAVGNHLYRGNQSREYRALKRLSPSELRRHEEGLSPTEAIRKAAAIRVRPVTMTALAAFFAMIPGAALAIERGSEANAPLARCHSRRPSCWVGNDFVRGPGGLFSRHP